MRGGGRRATRGRWPARSTGCDSRHAIEDGRRTMDAGQIAALTSWLGTRFGRVEIAALLLMQGGAIQQNWRLDALVDGVAQAWVLRTDAPATLAASRSRADEFGLLRAVHAAGVTVPEPLALCTDAAVIGRPFFIMRRVEGITDPPRVGKSETLGGGPDGRGARVGRRPCRGPPMRPPPWVCT